jgi:hypothetical protein
MQDYVLWGSSRYKGWGELGLGTFPPPLPPPPPTWCVSLLQHANKMIGLYTFFPSSLSCNKFIFMNHETYLWHKEPWPIDFELHGKLDLEECWWHGIAYMCCCVPYLGELTCPYYVYSHSLTLKLLLPPSLLASFVMRRWWYRKKEGDHSYPRGETHTSSSSFSKNLLVISFDWPTIRKREKTKCLRLTWHC